MLRAAAATDAHAWLQRCGALSVFWRVRTSGTVWRGNVHVGMIVKRGRVPDCPALVTSGRATASARTFYATASERMRVGERVGGLVDRPSVVRPGPPRSNRTDGSSMILLGALLGPVADLTAQRRCSVLSRSSVGSVARGGRRVDWRAARPTRRQQCLDAGLALLTEFCLRQVEGCRRGTFGVFDRAREPCTRVVYRAARRRRRGGPLLVDV